MSKIYSYVVIDTKLLCYNSSYYRGAPIAEFLNIVLRALIFNRIRYEKILFAHDIHKSKYRLDLFPGYKGGRKKNQDNQHHEEQSRRDIFVAQYKKLPNILQYIGVNINETLHMEADDCINIISEMEPDAKILGISLDMDWIFNSIDNPNIDILRYDKNILITSDSIDEYTINKYGLEAKELRTMSNICIQRKDSIPGVTHISHKRWEKYFVGLSYEDKLLQITDWIAEGKFGCSLSEESPNMLVDSVELTTKLMSPMSIEDLNDEELEEFERVVDGSKTPETLDYRDWIKLCLLELEVVPPIDEATFNALQNSIQKE